MASEEDTFWKQFMPAPQSVVDFGRNQSPPHEAFVPEVEIETNYSRADPWQQQVGGEHYKLPIQPLQYALANNLGIMEHAVVKYVTRHTSKGGKQDLEKARDYLDKMIAHYYS